MYVQRNIEGRSHNYCSSGKAITITYSECVSVALFIQHENLFFSEPYWKMLWHGNECGKTKVMRISRHPSPVTIMIGQNNWKMWNVLIIWVAC